jgi:outer membrane lipoprotein-sorting protein
MRDVRFRTAVTIATAVLVVGAASVGAAQTVDELLARNYQARGGLARLKSVSSMKMTGHMSAGGTELVMTTWMKRPNLMRQEMVFQGQRIVQAFDGTRAWTINPMAGTAEPVELPAGQADLVQTGADFDGPLVDYKAKGYTLEIVGTDTMDGAKLVKLKVTRKSGPALMLYLDAVTGLERKMTTEAEQGGQRVSIETVMSNYKAVSGMQVPFLVQSFANGQLAAEITVDSVELDTPMDDSLFTMPGRK